jgi:hypothetical protein
MNVEKIIPLIFTLAVAVITGGFTLLGSWLMSRSNLKQLNLRIEHETEKERRELLRSRLEELHSLVSKWAAAFVSSYLLYRRVMKNELSYNQANDLTIQQGYSADAHRMFTLAKIYFPQADNVFTEIEKLRDEASSIERSFRKVYEYDNTYGYEYAIKLTQVIEHFNIAIDKYQDSLVAYVRDL